MNFGCSCLGGFGGGEVFIFVWLSWAAFSSFTALESVREPVVFLSLGYNKSPAYEPSRCELSKIRTCMHMSS